MNMTETAKFFIDDLPKEICIETNTAVENPRFILVLRGSESCQSSYPVRLKECVPAADCKYTAIMEEHLAYCGEGIYDLELWDDCECCGSVCVELSADCYITSATMTSAASADRGCCSNV